MATSSANFYPFFPLLSLHLVGGSLKTEYFSFSLFPHRYCLKAGDGKFQRTMTIRSVSFFLCFVGVEASQRKSSVLPCLVPVEIMRRSCASAEPRADAASPPHRSQESATPKGICYSHSSTQVTAPTRDLPPPPPLPM